MRIPDDHARRLDEVSTRPLPYPFDVYERLGIPFG